MSRRVRVRGRMRPHPCPACGTLRRTDHPERLCLQCAPRARAAANAAREAAAEAHLAEPAPARYAPGTPEAVELLAARRAAGEHLWAAGDVADCEGLVGHPAYGPGTKGAHRGERRPPRDEVREPHAYPSHAPEPCGCRGTPGQRCPVHSCP